MRNVGKIDIQPCEIHFKSLVNSLLQAETEIQICNRFLNTCSFFVYYFTSAIEVQTIMSKQGERINNEELKEIIREADLDGDGFINFQGKQFYNNIVSLKLDL